MNRIEELMIEIDGKISYADSTGNCSDREELIEVKRALDVVNISRQSQEAEICDNCTRGSFFECGCKPSAIWNSKVLKCQSFRGDNGKV